VFNLTLLDHLGSILPFSITWVQSYPSRAPGFNLTLLEHLGSILPFSSTWVQSYPSRSPGLNLTLLDHLGSPRWFFLVESIIFMFLVFCVVFSVYFHSFSVLCPPVSPLDFPSSVSCTQCYPCLLWIVYPRFLLRLPLMFIEELHIACIYKLYQFTNIRASQNREVWRIPIVKKAHEVPVSYRTDCAVGRWFFMWPHRMISATSITKRCRCDISKQKYWLWQHPQLNQEITTSLLNEKNDWNNQLQNPLLICEKKTKTKQ
jgi:hypothetical protein